MGYTYGTTCNLSSKVTARTTDSFKYNYKFLFDKMLKKENMDFLSTKGVVLNIDIHLMLIDTVL